MGLSKAPHISGSNYVIHIVSSQNCSIPALYCLLPNNSGATYERLYTILKELAELKPELILCDFELAQSNAASAIFGCAIAYCYFHLSQNLFDKVEKLKLTKRYNTCEARINCHPHHLKVELPFQGSEQ